VTRALPEVSLQSESGATLDPRTFAEIGGQ